MGYLKITHCNDCPFISIDNEYGSQCFHPINADSTLQQINYDFAHTEQLPLNKDGKRYHSETYAIPTTCPLRETMSINIPQEVCVELDKQLFEENFTFLISSIKPA